MVPEIDLFVPVVRNIGIFTIPPSHHPGTPCNKHDMMKVDVLHRSGAPTRSRRRAQRRRVAERAPEVAGRARHLG